MSILLAKLLNYAPGILSDGESLLRLFVRRTYKAIGWLLVQVLMATAIMLPFNQTASAETAGWVTPPNVAQINYSGLNPPIEVPRMNFAQVATAQFTPNNAGNTTVAVQMREQESKKMITGEKWITLGQEFAGTLGATNAQVGNKTQRFAKTGSYIFAHYSPANASGRIMVMKVERMPNNQVKVFEADFTPFTGNGWAAEGDYRTAGETMLHMPGHNPFAAFAGSSSPIDPVFHNISWDGMKVAVGHAMRSQHATIGYVMMDNPHMAVNVSSSSSLFTNTVTTTYTGTDAPIWYVAMPMEAEQAGGETGQICVVGASAASCDDPAHVAIAGVIFSRWTGGNMPSAPTTMYMHTTSNSSWNVMFFVVILVVVTFGAASLLGAGIAAAAEAAAAAGIGYALINGTNLTTSQQNFFGQTGNGRLMPQASSSAEQTGLMNAVQQNVINTPFGQGQLASENQLFSGNCALGFAVSQCQQAGRDPGTAWRPDSFQQYNSTLAMRQRYASCSAPVSQGGYGLTGTAAEKCAAPVAAPMQ